MFALVDPPLASESAPASKHGPPHNPRSPDIAEHPALVTDPVGQSRLAEQLIELGPMLFGHAVADAGDPFFDVRRCHDDPSPPQ